MGSAKEQTVIDSGKNIFDAIINDEKNLSQLIFNQETNLFNSIVHEETNLFNSMENVQSNLFNSIVGSENNVISVTVNESNKISEKVEQLETLIKNSLIKEEGNPNFKYTVRSENHLYTLILHLDHSSDEQKNVYEVTTDGKSGLYTPDEQTQITRVVNNVTPEPPKTISLISEKFHNALLHNVHLETGTNKGFIMNGGFTNVRETKQIVFHTVVDSGTSDEIKRLNSPDTFDTFGELEIDPYNSLVKTKIYKMVDGENHNSSYHPIGVPLPFPPL